jgi:hypothetical protein
MFETRFKAARAAAYVSLLALQLVLLGVLAEMTPVIGVSHSVPPSPVQVLYLL